MNSSGPGPIFSSSAAERLQPFFDRMCDPIPLQPVTKPEWLKRRSEVREQVITALGLSPMPERLPLETRVGGTLERDGYRVERIYWQTWPEVWASGWLYRPVEIQGRVPAILNPHGHWENGARHPVVQSRLIALAKLGYLALAVDSIHVYDYALGVTPLTVMTYQNLRALDLLTSMPEVDRERIGITGASGGAQQAMYVLALDDRVRAGVLAAMVTYFRRILSAEGHHCPCNHVPGIMRFTDEPELCGIASPRALLFLTLTGDWTAEFPRQELGELRSLYSIWLQRDRLAHQQFEGPHDYSGVMREAAYAWFARELRGDRSGGPVPEPEVKPEPPELLAGLDSPPPQDRGSEGVLDWYRKRVIAQPPQLESRPSRRNYQERVRTDLIELLGGEPDPVTLDSEDHGTVEIREGGREVQKISLRSERDVRIPFLWRAPEPGQPTAVVVSPRGKSEAMGMPATRSLLDAGFGVLAADVRFHGELERDWLYNCIAWGRPAAGMAAHDIRACIHWLSGLAEVDSRALVVIGEGALGIAAMIAAGLDERITATVADCCSSLYRDGGERLPVIPNVLRVADVPQLASLSAPRPLWLYNVPAERVGFSSRRYYDWTRRSFQSLGDVEALKMETGGLPHAEVLADWLRTRIRRARR